MIPFVSETLRNTKENPKIKVNYPYHVSGKGVEKTEGIGNGGGRK